MTSCTDNNQGSPRIIIVKNGRAIADGDVHLYPRDSITITSASSMSSGQYGCHKAGPKRVEEHQLSASVSNVLRVLLNFRGCVERRSMQSRIPGLAYCVISVKVETRGILQCYKLHSASIANSSESVQTRFSPLSCVYGKQERGLVWLCSLFRAWLVRSYVLSSGRLVMTQSTSVVHYCLQPTRPMSPKAARLVGYLHPHRQDRR